MALARRFHILGSYWGFLLMNVHLGLHWNMVIRMAQKEASWWKMDCSFSIVLYAAWNGGLRYWKNRKYPNARKKKWRTGCKCRNNATNRGRSREIGRFLHRSMINQAVIFWLRILHGQKIRRLKTRTKWMWTLQPPQVYCCSAIRQFWYCFPLSLQVQYQTSLPYSCCAP